MTSLMIDQMNPDTILELSSAERDAIAVDAYVHGWKTPSIALMLGESRERVCQRLRRQGVLSHGRPAGVALQALDRALQAHPMAPNARPQAVFDRLRATEVQAQCSLSLVRERMQALRLGVYQHDPERERWCSPCQTYHPAAEFAPTGRICRQAWNALQRRRAEQKRRERGIPQRSERRAQRLRLITEIVRYSDEHGVTAASERFQISRDRVYLYRWEVRNVRERGA